MDRPIWVRLLAVLERNPESTTVTLNRASAEEMLREIKRLRAGGCARDQGTTQYCAEAAALAEENERLQAALAEIIKTATACTAIQVARAALDEPRT